MERGANLESRAAHKKYPSAPPGPWTDYFDYFDFRSESLQFLLEHSLDFAFEMQFFLKCSLKDSVMKPELTPTFFLPPGNEVELEPPVVIITLLS